MKIIHCADLHLDSKMETNLSKEQAAERKQELIYAFVRMIDYAREEDVKVILIAGDLFDTPVGEQKRIKNRVLEQIENAGDIDFIYLRGNHDKGDFFDTLEKKPDNLKTFTDNWTSYSYGNIIITGCELNKTTKSSIYDELVLKEENINIVVLHGQEVNTGSKNDGEVIYLNKLQNKYIDYLALGHIHKYKYETLDRRGNYCYCGCLEGRGFDECGVKGFVLLDVNEKIHSINHTFIENSYRVCHEIVVNIDKCNFEKDVTAEIENSIEGITQKDMIKIILNGEISEELQYDTTFIEKYFKDRFYFFKIKDESRLKINYEKYKDSVSLKGEFIRLVEASDMDEQEKNQIILTGIRALEGRAD